ncbi:MAG: hypothetical protein AAB563_00465 [Patescibacteria group bacterium]
MAPLSLPNQPVASTAVNISERDKTLFRLLADTKSNREIALAIRAHEEDVGAILQNLYNRYGIEHHNRRVAAGCLAVRLGIVQ